MNYLAIDFVTAYQPTITGFNIETTYYEYIVSKYPWFDNRLNKKLPPLAILQYCSINNAKLITFCGTDSVIELIRYLHTNNINRVGMELDEFSFVGVGDIIRAIKEWDTSIIIDLMPVKGSEYLVNEIKKDDNIIINCNYTRDNLLKGVYVNSKYYNESLNIFNRTSELYFTAYCGMGCTNCTAKEEGGPIMLPKLVKQIERLEQTYPPDYIFITNLNDNYSTNIIKNLELIRNKLPKTTITYSTTFKAFEYITRYIPEIGKYVNFINVYLNKNNSH